MFKTSAAKRTGIYRVSGNMSDFRMNLKLKNISEWLPVPKFEYAGRPDITLDSSSTYSPSNTGGGSAGAGSCATFDIYIPQSDEYGCYNGYYNYYNPSNEFHWCSAGSLNSARGSNHTKSKFTTSSPKKKQAQDSPKSGHTINSARSNHFPAIEDGYASAEQHSGRSNKTYSKHADSLQSSPTAFSYTNMTALSQLSSDSFYQRNKELCNGGIANIKIAWQQKHFSRSELERYSELSNCGTKLQRRYHRWANEMIMLQERYMAEQLLHIEPVRIRRRPRLRKSKSKQRNKSEASFNSFAESANVSSLPMSEFSLAEDPNFAARTCLIHTVLNADDEQLSPEALEWRQAGFQLMYVYADLEPDTLLVTLRFSKEQGLLYVYPDFSCSVDDMDYIVEINKDYRQLYAYGFQNVTPLQPLEEEEEFSSTLSGLRHLGKTHAQPEQLPSDASTDQLVGYYQRQRAKAEELRSLSQFELPPKRMQRVTLLLQLQQGQHFEYPNIHVRYYVSPPPYTILEPALLHDPFPLRGSTHTCLDAGDARVAHFAHCWQLTLLCEEQYDVNALLHIYFEVISIDSWERERCEGYAHFACSLLDPLPAASRCLKLQCMRPKGNWLDALNRYFIGGRQLFDFVGFFSGQRAGSERELCNRLQTQPATAMCTTGTLWFSAQKLQQSQPEEQLFGICARSKMYQDIKKAGKFAGKSTLEEVIASYVDARERVRTLLS